MAQNLQKKPSKGILKTSRSVDAQETPSTSKRPKEQRFDERNILETFHPADKDYGHMKIDEPKTPFSETVEGEGAASDEVDANLLAAKLAASMNKPPKCVDASEEDEFHNEDPESRQKRLDFESKRKMHYNEFQALQLARQLMAQDEDDEDEDGATAT